MSFVEEDDQCKHRCAPATNRGSIGKRWSGAIISVMLKGASRFCELREAIPGISDRLLTERLKELETAGIVTREVEPTRPPQVSYRLTPKGQALIPVLGSIASWGHDWE